MASHVEGGEEFSAILAAAQAGQPAALSSLHRSIAPAVLAYLALQGAEDPDDLTNEVLFGALSGLKRFSGEEPAWRTWVLAIAHRRMVDEWRRRSRRVPIAVGSGPDGPDSSVDPVRLSPSAEDAAIGRLASADVVRFCRGLPRDQRDVILLRLVADLSVRQVSEALGKSDGAVKALQRRGVEALRRQLSREIEFQGVPE